MPQNDLLFKVISAIGAITGSWALIRSYWLTRSKLVLSQKRPDWSKYHQQGGVGNLDVTLLVANHSSRANAIVRWEAWLKDVGGSFRAIDSLQGQETLTTTHEVVKRFNVVPFAVPPYGVVDGFLTFFTIRQSDFTQPFELKVRASDMYGKKFECICTHPCEPSA